MFIIIGLLFIIILVLTKTGKSIISGVFVLMVLFYFMLTSTCNSCGSGNSSKHEKSESDSPTTQSSETVYLSSQDSTDIRERIIKIGSKIDKLRENAEKSNKQYRKFATLYVNGDVSDYECFETAKIAKEAMSHAENTMLNLDLPDKLPHSLKDTLNMAISDIQSYYSIMGSAYDVVIDVMKNKGNEMSNIDDYKNKVGLADEDYEKGVLELQYVKSSMRISNNKHKTKNSD